MKVKKGLALLLSSAMLLGNAMGVTAYDGIIHDDSGNISYVPLEQGTYSNGGYSIDKISHPTLGSGEIDGILTGEDQDRGNSYSWSAVESGDYVYIGTCYNSTYYIYHNNVSTTLTNMKNEGILDADVDVSQVASDIVEVMFGVDTFDTSKMDDWSPVIIAVNKYTGEAQLVFKERDIWSQYPDIFPGYSPLMATKNYLSGYRMAFEFQDKLYFAGMGSPTATLVELKFEFDDGRAVYEGKLREGRMEYEFEIDAVSGSILQWEQDWD